jgi:hypothetical protein
MFAHPHPCSITVFITSPYKSVDRQIFNITPKTYYYIAPFKICEPVERAFLHTLIVWCPYYKNNMDTKLVNNLT